MTKQDIKIIQYDPKKMIDLGSSYFPKYVGIRVRDKHYITKFDRAFLFNPIEADVYLMTHYNSRRKEATMRKVNGKGLIKKVVEAIVERDTK